MDNDVFGTDYCLGFSTAVTRSVMFINDLRTGAGSHERFLVVELFGRYSGETCLLASYLAGVDRAVIAEVPFDCDKLYHLLDADRSDNPSNYAVTAISGSGPAYLFFVVEAMIEAGVHLGLPRDTATELVVQTMLGSAKLLRETGEHPTVLRERVTSPGGTTAATWRPW